jgi:hypothetical protein
VALFYGPLTTVLVLNPILGDFRTLTLTALMCAAASLARVLALLVWLSGIPQKHNAT